MIEEWIIGRFCRGNSIVSFISIESCIRVIIVVVLRLIIEYEKLIIIYFKVEDDFNFYTYEVRLKIEDLRFNIFLGYII